MNYFSSYIFIIFTFKIIFVIMAFTERYLKLKKQEKSQLYKLITYWKARVEFIFAVLMSFLLIYLFNPRINRINMVNGETKLLLFLFGFVLLITADWSNFFDEAVWFQNLQEDIGR